ncbi:UNVERIFIED_CONTAM: hypothetical protein FKN15_005477 [Acipenser sinensis]
MLPWQEALLAAISEKDANIALLELSSSKKKKTQEEVMALKREKDRLVHQLKQQAAGNMYYNSVLSVLINILRLFMCSSLVVSHKIKEPQSFQERATYGYSP